MQNKRFAKCKIRQPKTGPNKTEAEWMDYLEILKKRGNHHLVRV